MNKTFCVNVRFVDAELSVPTTRLYRLLSVDSDGGAEALFQLLEQALKDDGISWDSVVGYASDGENLMQGANNSFLTRMQEKAPGLYVLKCYCHTFHLIASHASEKISKSSEQLLHDIYNYFKNSPNRKKSLQEFQHFLNYEPLNILKPCQTRWLSVSECVTRVLAQWKPLEMYFTTEVFETKHPQAERILQSLKSPYMQATLEFMQYVLGDISGLNMLFQSNDFKLHRFLPELTRVLKMFCNNFMHREAFKELKNINVEDQANWVPLQKVFPGILAFETIKVLKPHEKESFLSRCRGWLKEAITQILTRIDIEDPVLKAVQSIHQSELVSGKSSLDAASVLQQCLPRIPGTCKQTIDRQWRSLLIDDEILDGDWKEAKIESFWKSVSEMESYEALGNFMLQITALPQSTAVVERTFSKINNNKTKLRNRLAVRTIEALIKVDEGFPSSFDISARLSSLYSNARGSYMERYNKSEQEVVENIEQFD
eukprot:gene14780-16316_t